MFQPFFAIDGGRASRTGGGDGLAVVGVDDVARGENALDARGVPWLAIRSMRPAGATIPCHAKAVRVSK